MASEGSSASENSDTHGTPDGPESAATGKPDEPQEVSAQPLALGAADVAALEVLLAERRLPRWFWRAIVAVAFSVGAFLVVKGALGKLEGLLRIIVVSLFVAFALEPAVNRLAKRGWKRGRATLFCFLVVFGFGGVFTAVMVNLVVSQTSELVHHAPEYVNDATSWINQTFDTDITSKELNKTIRKYQEDLTKIATDVGGRALTVTGAVVAVVFQMFTVFLFSYYMIAQGPEMRRNLCSLLPARRQQMVLELWELSVDKTGGWVFSRVLLALASSASSWLAFSIIGIPSPLALALWMGVVSQFIPVVGTYLGGALPVLLALTNSPLTALWVVIWVVVYQQVENYVLSPRITGHTMDLHPAVAFGAALAGASVFGAVGAILALPAAAVIQAFVSTYLERHEVVESALTQLRETD